MNKNDNLKRIRINALYALLIVSEIILIFLLASFFSTSVLGGAGTNVTVITTLNVGNVPPEILWIGINNGASTVSLNANSTRLVYCEAVLRDYNNDTDFNVSTGEFYDKNVSDFLQADDNNYHYTNSSCNITRNFTGTFHGFTDDQFLAIANCSFQVYYYANPTDWNCTMFVNDTISWNSTNGTSITVNELIALAVPNSINYGTVNATYMSLENITNISNGGNVKVNISLSGYAVNLTDGLAMNCSLGNLKNISIQHEKFNLTASNPTADTLALATVVYTNLTSNVSIKKFELDYRRQDSYDDANNLSYWKIYVPLGVAGTCRGNIIMGATKAAGT